jgi:hypothetical protein
MAWGDFVSAAPFPAAVDDSVAVIENDAQTVS